MAEEEIEYESDPEEAKLSLQTRRRVASDDEAEDGGDIRGTPRRRDVDFDGESEGAVSEYENEYGDEEEEEVYDLDEEYVEDIVVVRYEESGCGTGEDCVNALESSEPVESYVAVKEDKLVDVVDGEFSHENEDDKHEGKKKEIEPYTVPTEGSFYMHDDRFRDNAGVGNRRTLNGSRLWESKDDRKWGHDKFEELTMHDRRYDIDGRKRGSSGRFRGRGMNRAVERGHYQESSRTTRQSNHVNQNVNGQNNYSKVIVRGRGPRRYQPSLNNNETPLTQKKPSWKSIEKRSEPAVVRPSKKVSASNLNISSPPFYPSSSTTDDNVLSNINIRDSSRNGPPKVDGENFITEQLSEMLQGKNAMDSIVMDRLYIDDSLPLNIKQMPTQQQSRGQGREISSFAQMTYQPVGSNNQVNRGNPPDQLQTSQISPGQIPSRQHISNGLQAASTLKVSGTLNKVESEQDALSGRSKPKTALVPIAQGSGRSSFLYGGAQVLGTSGNMGPGDQNFPAFFPVMQFGGQHPSGMGVPAVGMAFPGYVGQPQHGVGNSEMTWLPILAGTAGAHGARYCPPYVSADNSLHAPSSGPTSFTTDVSSTHVGDDWKTGKQPDLANNDSGQRQKNPRRYTEMKFDQ